MDFGGEEENVFHFHRHCHFVLYFHHLVDVEAMGERHGAVLDSVPQCYRVVVQLEEEQHCGRANTKSVVQDRPPAVLFEDVQGPDIVVVPLNQC